MFNHELIHSPLLLREESPGNMMENFAFDQDEFSMLQTPEMIVESGAEPPSAMVQDLLPMAVRDVSPDWSQSLMQEKQLLDGAAVLENSESEGAIKLSSTALPSTATDGTPSVPRLKPPTAPEMPMNLEMVDWMPRPNRGEPQPNFRGGMMPQPDVLLGTGVEVPWICTLMDAPVESVDETPVIPLFSHHSLMPMKPVMQMSESGFSMQHPFPRLSNQDAMADLGGKRLEGRQRRQGHWAQHLERFRQERSSCEFSLGMESPSTRPLLLSKNNPFPCVFAHDTKRLMGLDLVSSELPIHQA
jgi:hypothetical protein